MADIRVIEYGNQRIPVDAGVTQEQAKQQMARFFPELADPKIESKKEGDKTVWVFSKKAGTKGVTDCQRVAAALAKLPAWQAVPPAVADAIQRQEGAALDEADTLVESLRAQAQAVHAARQALLDVPAAGAPAGDVL